VGVRVSVSLTLEAIRQRYGESTPRRQFLFTRLQTVIRLLIETGQLRCLYLFGSFTTTKPDPGDLDCLAVMAAGFTTATLASPYLEVFQHDTCRLLYQADVFWVTEAITQEHLDAMLNVFARDREGVTQPIVEVIL
jgi:hypothetical protein